MNGGVVSARFGRIDGTFIGTDWGNMQVSMKIGVLVCFSVSAWLE